MRIVRTHRGALAAVAVSIAVALVALMPGAVPSILAQTAGPVEFFAPNCPHGFTGSPGGQGPFATPAEADAGRPDDCTAMVPGTGISVGIRLNRDISVVDDRASREALLASIAAAIGTAVSRLTITSTEAGSRFGVNELMVADVNRIGFLPRQADIVQALPGTLPLTLTISPEVLAQAGGDLGRVVLRFFNTDTDTFDLVQKSGLPVGTDLTWGLLYYGDYFLFVAPEQTQLDAPLPAATGASPWSTGADRPALLAALAAVGLGAAGVLGLRAARRRA